MMAQIFLATPAAIHKHYARFSINFRSTNSIIYLFTFQISNWNTPERRSIQTTRASSASWNSTHVDEFSDSHSESLYLFVDSFSAAMFRSEEQRTEPNDGGERIDLDAMSRLIEHT